MRIRVATVLAWAAASVTACSDGSGSLSLRLQLPSPGDLRPSGMTTVTVTAQLPGELPISTTSVLDGSAFNAGELPAGDGVEIGVVLRDVSNRIVGVGNAAELVDIANDALTEVAIPVRRPFVYAADAAAPAGALVSFDPTRDARDMKFQGSIAGSGKAKFTLSVGGDRLAIVTDTQVLVVITSTNAVAGMISIPATPTDAAAVPGTSKLAVASAMGITIVDLDSTSVTTADTGPVDRVTVGMSENGEQYAYGLVGRVIAPELPPPMGRCSTTPSSLVAVPVNNPIAAAPRTLGKAVSDLAAAPDVAMLFATLPCDGQVASVEGDATAEIGSLSTTNLVAVERAAVLAVAGSRVWVAGTRSAVAECDGACTMMSEATCNTPMPNPVLQANDGAAISITSMSYDGKDTIELVAPPRRETIIDARDAAGQHAQVLKAMSAVPLDLVTLPGGQYVSLVARSYYFIQALPDPFYDVSLPCLEYETNDWMLFDLASSSIAQRVRTYCAGESSPNTINDAQFPLWECDVPPEAERSLIEYRPTSVGALFGAR